MAAQGKLVGEHQQHLAGMSSYISSYKCYHPAPLFPTEPWLLTAIYLSPFPINIPLKKDPCYSVYCPFLAKRDQQTVTQFFSSWEFFAHRKSNFCLLHGPFPISIQPYIDNILSYLLSTEVIKA